MKNFSTKDWGLKVFRDKIYPDMNIFIYHYRALYTIIHRFSHDFQVFKWAKWFFSSLIPNLYPDITRCYSVELLLRINATLQLIYISNQAPIICHLLSKRHLGCILVSGDTMIKINYEFLKNMWLVIEYIFLVTYKLTYINIGFSLYKVYHRFWSSWTLTAILLIVS